MLYQFLQLQVESPIVSTSHDYGASLVAQMVKNFPAVQETQVRSLGQEDPLEKGMATDSSILAWRIPWTEEPSRLKSMRSQRVGHNRSNLAPPSVSTIICRMTLFLIPLINI